MVTSIYIRSSVLEVRRIVCVCMGGDASVPKAPCLSQLLGLVKALTFRERQLEKLGEISFTYMCIHTNIIYMCILA